MIFFFSTKVMSCSLHITPIRGPWIKWQYFLRKGDTYYSLKCVCCKETAVNCSCIHTVCNIMILIAITLRYLHCGHPRWNAMVCRCRLSCLYFFLCVLMFNYTKYYYTFCNFSYKSGKKCIAFLFKVNTFQNFRHQNLIIKLNFCSLNTVKTVQIVIQFLHHIYGQPLDNFFQNIKKTKLIKDSKDT